MRESGQPSTGELQRERIPDRASPRTGVLHSDSIFPPLPDARFDIIYADPPWDYQGQLQHTGRDGKDSGGAVRHFPTIPLADLKCLPVASIASNDCLLFMWSTGPHLDQAVELGKSWGFAWATIAFVWDKCKVNPGHYTMSQCELCLVFKRGRIPTPRGARNVRQLITVERQAHSAKPEEVRRRIDIMFPEATKVELFARDATHGSWTAWGLEAVTTCESGGGRVTNQDAHR